MSTGVLGAQKSFRSQLSGWDRDRALAVGSAAAAGARGVVAATALAAAVAVDS